MGGVNFSYLVKPGNNPVTSFSNSMINLGGALAGLLFYACYSKGNGTAGVDVDSQVNSGASGIVFGSGSGVNNNATRVAWFPQSVDNTAMRAGCQTRGQFVQWTLVSRTAGIDCECPLIAFGDPSGNDGGYILTTQSETNNVSLAQGWGTAVQYNIHSNIFTAVANDVIRMEVTYTPAANTIKTYKNGVLQSTDVDNNAARPSSGLAGFGLLGVFTGVLVFKDFSCGLI